MDFKVHLIVISAIIATVWVIWSLLPKTVVPVETAPAIVEEVSKFNIIINHASWGLNCKSRSRNRNNASDVFANSEGNSGRLHEDNVLNAVSELCNGKKQCEILLNASVLGEDPAPDCREKFLEVEYRCFSYDRPWTARTSSGKLAIECKEP